jgi:hypothetical protein
MEIKIVAISGILLSGLTFSALVLGEESAATAQSAAENVQNVPQAQQPRMRPGPGYPGPGMRGNRGYDMPMMGRGWDRGDMPMMGRGWDRGDMPMMGGGQRYPRYYGPGPGQGQGPRQGPSQGPGPGWRW